MCRDFVLGDFDGSGTDSEDPYCFGFMVLNLSGGNATISKMKWSLSAHVWKADVLTHDPGR